MNRKYLEIAAWFCGIVLALCIAARFWSVAFPVAAVPFPLSQQEVRQEMARFLAGMGAPLDGSYRNAVDFGEESETKNFIERQYGPTRLAQSADNGIAVWYWYGRWFKPGQHEEYRASANQRGEIVGYTHVIEEERALPSLDETAARAIAEKFLQAHIQQHPFTTLHYLEQSTEEKPHRKDWTFVWEAPALRIGDAPYHLTVTVQGNQVGAYSEYLKIPEWWLVQYARQRSVNDLFYKVASFAASALALGLLIWFIIGINHHQVRWRDPIPWGWVVVIGLVAAASRINGVSGILMGYQTTQEWGAFVTGAIFDGARGVLGQMLLFWSLVMMGDFLYRKGFPDKSSFRRALGPLALRDPGTITAMGIGIAFAIFSLAYVCLFYAAGQRLGVWCPIEVDLSKTMSGPLPWIEGMQTGFTAAFYEELIFRIGAILLLLRLVRVRWLAVVLAAAAWGFMHSNYPQMPGYTRGIELTLVGVVWGALLLRYGIVATLTAHYLYDCWMGCLVMLHGASWGNKAGAIVASMWPVALFLFAVLRKAETLEPEQAHAPARPVIDRPPAHDWRNPPLGLGRTGIALVLAGCAAAIAAILFLPRPQQKIMELGKLDWSRSAILKQADAALQARGYSPAGYMRVAGVYANGLPYAYLLEHGTLDDVAALHDRAFPDLYWQVRYFRFLQPEEFSVKLDQHGQFITWSHTILAEAPGASLDLGPALTIAAKALTAESIDMRQQTPILTRPIQQEHRRDWIFGFDARDFHWGDARMRTYLEVQGSEPINLLRGVKVPDAWILEHAKSGWKQLLSGELQRWLGIGVDGSLAVLLVLVMRRHLTPWRRAFLYALAPLALRIVHQVNQLCQFYAAYSTTIPKAQYIATQLATRLEGLGWDYLTDVFSIAVALGLLHWAWRWTPEQRMVSPGERRRYLRDTLLVAFASVLTFWTLDLVNAEVLGHFWPAEAAGINYWSVEEWVPWLAAVTAALRHGFDELIPLAVQASILRLIWLRNRKLAWGFLLLLPVLNLGVPESLGGFIWSLVYAEARLLLTAWLALKVWRFNILAVFLTYTMASLWEQTGLFLQKGGPAYQWQAAPLIALTLLVPLIGWIWARGDVQPVERPADE